MVKRAPWGAGTVPDAILTAALPLRQGLQNSLTEEEMGSERLRKTLSLTQPVSS